MYNQSTPGKHWSHCFLKKLMLRSFAAIVLVTCNSHAMYDHEYNYSDFCRAILWAIVLILNIIATLSLLAPKKSVVSILGGHFHERISPVSISMVIISVSPRSPELMEEKHHGINIITNRVVSQSVLHRDD